MAFPNEHLAKANDSRSLSNIFIPCRRTINPHLEKELALPEPSWQEQQECTLINNQGARNASGNNKNTVRKVINLWNFVDIANMRITIMRISNNKQADARI